MQQYPLRSRAGSYSDIFVAVGQIVTACIRQRAVWSHDRRLHLTLFRYPLGRLREVSQTDYFPEPAYGEQYAATSLCGPIAGAQ